MTCERVSQSLKSLLKLVSRMVLEELSFQVTGPHRTKWTQPRLGGKSMETNDVLTLDKVGERIKEIISLEDVVLTL